VTSCSSTTTSTATTRSSVTSISTFRADFQGQRTGYKTTYFEHTLGVSHYFYDWLVFRPEIRFDYTSGAKAIDDGTKREMFTFSADLIIRF